MNFRRMVKCWVSDTLTTIHGVTNDDCKNAIDEISENISPMEIMMGGEGSGHRWGDLRSTQGTGGDVCTQMMKHHCCCVLLLMLLLLLLQKYCCCSSWSYVYTNKHSFDVVIEAAGENKKKDERRRLWTLMRKLLLLLALNVYKKYEVHYSVNF